MTRKKGWGAHARWCAVAIFQLTELNIKANPPCFARARAHARALMTRKSCAVEMRNAILRNYLNQFLPLTESTVQSPIRVTWVTVHIDSVKGKKLILICTQVIGIELLFLSHH